MKENVRDTNKLCWIIMAAVVVYALTSCQSYVDYINNTPVRTVTVDRTPHYNSFYNPYGLGYYNNFYNRQLYRPVYRPHVIRPTRAVKPQRRVIRPQRPKRVVRPVRSGNRTVVRRNVGRRQ